MTPPILFLIFNRPDKTQAIFETIRDVRPARLYVAADGPRNPSEAKICAETRAVVNQVDWPCEVKALFREQNLGCGKAVSGAITWFFENEPEGVIIEDDIRLDPSFFEFAAEMLDRYRDDPRVTTVSACNMLPAELAPEESYFFSNYCHIWGWASWRRAWSHYDFEMTNLDDPIVPSLISQVSSNPKAVEHWIKTFEKVRDGFVDTWDYQWVFAQWMQRGLTINPRVNMMQNIGFDDSATHTTDSASWEASLRASPLQFPLVHPTKVVPKTDADDFETLNVFGIKPLSLSKRIKHWLRGDYSAGF